MNDSFEKLCKKHSLTEQAKLDIKNLIEREIIKVFYKKSDETTTVPVKKTVVRKKNTSVETCQSKKADGEECTSPAKENGYCGRHNPDKKTTVSTKSKNKKESKHEC